MTSDEKRQQAMIARIFWTLLFLGACIGWLVLSYRPQLLVGIEMSFGSTPPPIFLWLFAGSSLVFILIQAVLVAGVRTFPVRIARGETTADGSEASTAKDIRIHPGAEYFWTALPLLISLFFFWTIWQTFSK
jgi:heme/copper-type cytochrome/quinol oxidase subunit 2